MKYAKIEDNIVVQVQPNAQDGFIQVDNSVVCGMIKNGDSFENPVIEKTEEEIKKEKRNSFRKEWDNLKVGYSPNYEIAFQIKYGKEIGDNLLPDSLYNIADINNPVLVNETDNLYKCDENSMSILSIKMNSEYKAIEERYWHGSLGSYPLDTIEVGIILAKADEIVQSYADTILGE